MDTDEAALEMVRGERCELPAYVIGAYDFYRNGAFWRHEPDGPERRITQLVESDNWEVVPDKLEPVPEFEDWKRGDGGFYYAPNGQRWAWQSLLGPLADRFEGFMHEGRDIPQPLSTMWKNESGNLNIYKWKNDTKSIAYAARMRNDVEPKETEPWSMYTMPVRKEAEP